jgi:hypothetical protein
MIESQALQHNASQKQPDQPSAAEVEEDEYYDEEAEEVSHKQQIAPNSNQIQEHNHNRIPRQEEE